MKVTFVILTVLFMAVCAISKLYSQEVVTSGSESKTSQQLVVSSSESSRVGPQNIPLNPNATVIKIFSAILTPFVALFASYIAWQQLSTNRKKLKLDLFDKRFEVYEATKKYLSKISAAGDVKNDDLADFQIETNKSYFLFGNDIEEYLRELYLKGVDLNYTQKQLRSSGLSKEERIKVVEKDQEAFTWLTAQQLNSKNIFGKYMRFEK